MFACKQARTQKLIRLRVKKRDRDHFCKPRVHCLAFGDCFERDRAQGEGEDAQELVDRQRIRDVGKVCDVVNPHSHARLVGENLEDWIRML